MKKSISVPQIIAIIAVVAVVIGLIFWKSAGPGNNKATIDNYFQNGPMSSSSASKTAQPSK